MRTVQLDPRHSVGVGRLPDDLRLDAEAFESLWDRRPQDFETLRIHGRTVPAPRWMQACERRYAFNGGGQDPVPLPTELRAIADWLRAHVDGRLDGALLVWYHGPSGHYIGPHRDNRAGLVVGAPIVTVSFGCPRTFRLRRWKGRDRHDLEVADGDVVVLPWETNLAWTHEVPRRIRSGRRISLTLRAFA